MSNNFSLHTYVSIATLTKFHFNPTIMHISAQGQGVISYYSNML